MTYILWARCGEYTISLTSHLQRMQQIASTLRASWSYRWVTHHQLISNATAAISIVSLLLISLHKIPWQQKSSIILLLSSVHCTYNLSFMQAAAVYLLYLLLHNQRPESLNLSFENGVFNISVSSHFLVFPKYSGQDQVLRFQCLALSGTQTQRGQ